MLCSPKDRARAGHRPFCDCCNGAPVGRDGRRLNRRREKAQWQRERLAPDNRRYRSRKRFR